MQALSAPGTGKAVLGKDQVSTSPVAIAGDVAVDLSDVDGIANPGHEDLRGTARGQVAVDRDYLLSQLREFVKSDGKKAITRIAFDAARRTYVVEGHAKLFGRWRGPGFSVEMTADRAGHLVIRGRSWADPILRLFRQPTVTDWVEKALQAYRAPLKTSRAGGRLFVEGIRNLTVPLGSENIKLTISDYTPRAGNPGPFSIGADGRVITGLEGQVRGFIWHGEPTGPAEKPDQAKLQVHFVARADRSVSTRVSGSATVGITEAQLRALTGQRGEVLFPLLKSGSATFGDLVIEGNYSDTRHWESKLAGKLRVETPQGLRIETPFESEIDDAGKRVTASAGPIYWRDPFNGVQLVAGLSYEQDPDGKRLDVSEPPDAPIAVPYTANRLGLWVGGDEYYRNLLAAVGRASESVLLETFGYPEGERTARLMEALLLRAAAGTEVKLLVDPGPFGTENWAGRVQATLAGEGEDAWTRRFMAGRSETELARIRGNLRVQEHPGGLARTDHRKVVVIDGVLGITGGVNVGDGHFSTVQDAMVPVIGPAVRDLAREFLRTWSEDGGSVTADDRAALLESDGASGGAGRFEDLVSPGASRSRVLVTDDLRNEIETAYLEAIDGAREEVKLEQQYFTERRIVDALVRAVGRGVAVTIVVPEDQDNEFELGNDLALLRLLQAAAKPGAGPVDLRYYQTRGTWSHHVHSKILVADGKRALVGSANVDQRAMRGLATTPRGRLLWNKELDLDVADPAFAGRVDREVFGADARPSESRDVWEKIAARRMEAPARRDAGDLGALGERLRALARDEAAAALRAAGHSPAEETARSALQAVLSRFDATWEATWNAARDPRVDRKRFVSARLPAGRGRDVELALLARSPDAGSWARAAAHASLYELEGAVAALYRAGGYPRHAGLAKGALRPDEQRARLSDAFNILF